MYYRNHLKKGKRIEELEGNGLVSSGTHYSTGHYTVQLWMLWSFISIFEYKPLILHILEDFSCLEAAQTLLKLTNTYYVIYQIRFIVLNFISTTLKNFVLVESLKIIINNKEPFHVRRT